MSRFSPSTDFRKASMAGFFTLGVFGLAGRPFTHSLKDCKSLIVVLLRLFVLLGLLELLL